MPLYCISLHVLAVTKRATDLGLFNRLSLMLGPQYYCPHNNNSVLIWDWVEFIKTGFYYIAQIQGGQERRLYGDVVTRRSWRCASCTDQLHMRQGAFCQY